MSVPAHSSRVGLWITEFRERSGLGSLNLFVSSVLDEERLTTPLKNNGCSLRNSRQINFYVSHSQNVGRGGHRVDEWQSEVLQ